MQDNRRLNSIGSAFMVAAMAAFAVEDALIKRATQDIPVALALMLFGVGGAALFALMARLQGHRLWTRDALSRPMVIRVGFEITGRLFYVLALWLAPLSSATVILQATPLVVVAGAALFMGEQVGWRRWSAIFIGLTGVLIILQPGADSFSPLSILAVIGMLGFAGRDLASRAAPKTLSTSALGFFGFLSILAAGVLLHLIRPMPLVLPSASTSLALAAATIAGVLAYSALMRAMRTGAVSAVTPFRYTRLIFGIGLGVLVFGESLSPSMVLGSGLIVLSGLFILARGAAKSRPAPKA
jgi:drug/metabolite transporter (DMT)-like permease